MRKFNFELSILGMNAMYKLPIAPYPTIHREVAWQREKFPALQVLPPENAINKRLHSFFGAPKSILADELSEYEGLLSEADEVEFLVGLADLLADIQVYCASEMARFGLPNQEVLEIVMASNESKLDENGLPIYNDQGKFMKGPNYWAPEDKIRQLIVELRQGKDNGPLTA